LRCRLAMTVPQSQPAPHWVVMAAPEGNKFCVATEPFSDT
jgi:hypothetical protein